MPERSEMSPLRAGTANLPLHVGHVPKWLADRMNPARRGRLAGDRAPLWER
jgi:hypothetical protein